MEKVYEYAPGFMTDGRGRWRVLTVGGYERRGVALLMECTSCGRVKAAPVRRLMAMGLGERPLGEIEPRMRCRGAGKDLCGGRAKFRSGMDREPP